MAAVNRRRKAHAASRSKIDHAGPIVPSGADAYREELRAAHKEAEDQRKFIQQRRKDDAWLRGGRGGHISQVDMRAVREEYSDTTSVLSTPTGQWRGTGEVPAIEARDLLRTALRPSSILASQTGIRALRRDLAARISTDKIVTETLHNSLSGIRALFQGPGEEALKAWGKIAAKGKHMSEDTAQDIHTLQSKVGRDAVLRTIESYQRFIAKIFHLAQSGAAARARILELGGGEMLVAACRFVRDEQLLDQALGSLALLSTELAGRRYLVKRSVFCPEVLCEVVARTITEPILEKALGTIELLSLEDDVTQRLVDYDILEAVVRLCSSVDQRRETLIRRLASTFHLLVRDEGGLRAMRAFDERLTTCLLRFLVISDDATVVASACTALEGICVDKNRFVIARHASLGKAMRTVLTRAAEAPAQHIKHVKAAGRLLVTLCNLKETRDRLGASVRLDKPLVRLIISRRLDQAANAAVTTAIKTFEIDEVMRDHITAEVETLAPVMLAELTAPRPKTGRAPEAPKATNIMKSNTGHHWSTRLPPLVPVPIEGDEYGLLGDALPFKPTEGAGDPALMRAYLQSSRVAADEGWGEETWEAEAGHATARGA